MITWVTVWVLTVVGSGTHATTYQLEYRTQQTCLTEMKKHIQNSYKPRCDFKQIPMVTK